MTLPCSDAFSGSDGEALTSYSSNWSLNLGNFEINSSAVRANAGADCGARWNGDVFAADHYAEVDYNYNSATATYIGPAVRLATDGTANYYGYYFAYNYKYLLKVINGTWTEIASFGGDTGFAHGLALRLEIEGNTLRPKIAGVLDSNFGTQTDSAFVTGAAGICGYGSGNGARADNFVGGNLVVAPAITYFGSASTPADGATAAQAGPGPITITPPASMVLGDLVVVTLQYKATGVTFSVANAGGQTWNPLAEFTTTGIEGQVFWCRFNGTWSANPTFQINAGTLALTGVMHAFRPSDGDNNWDIDVAQVEMDFAAPSSPFTVTITGPTAIAASTLTLAAWFTSDDNTWGTLAGSGWVVTGSAQYRNTTGTDQSCTFAHRIGTSAGAVPNVSKQQATLGGDAGTTIIVVFKEIVSVVGYDIVAEPGDYDLIGFTSGVLATRLIGALPGGYSATGIAMSPVAGRMVNAQAGSYGVTGSAAGVLAARMVNAQAGGYSATGFVADLVKTGLAVDYPFHAEPGIYALSGLPASAVAGRMLTAASGAYSATGFASSILAGRMINAATGSYVFSGIPASVVSGRAISAIPGAYMVTGNAAAIFADRILTLAPGSYSIAGVAAGLVVVTVGAYVLDVQPGLYLVTGSVAAALANRLLSAGTGSYSALGTPAILSRGRFLSAVPGVYAISGEQAALTLARMLQALSGQYIVTGALAELLYAAIQTTGDGWKFTSEEISFPKFSPEGIADPVFVNEVIRLSKFAFETIDDPEFREEMIRMARLEDEKVTA